MKHLTLIILLSGLVILSACSENPEEQKEEILTTVLSNLEEIESADFLSYKEAWAPGDNVLATYRKRTGLDYTFLMSEKEVNSAYNIHGTPVIFILDADRIIQEVVNGYGGESTDNEIIDSINRLI